MVDNTFSPSEMSDTLKRVRRWKRDILWAVYSMVLINAAILGALIWWGISVSMLILVASSLVLADMGGLLAAVYFRLIGILMKSQPLDFGALRTIRIFFCRRRALTACQSTY